MSGSVLLISDLHLEPARPRITEALFRFLDDHSTNCRALYILGDLFEAWIGDDAPSPLGDAVAGRLAEFAGNGSRLYLMHGNRDFLLGDDYASRCGGELIEDPYVLESGPESYLLLHGDTLCTDDVEYQAFRAQVRDRAWQAQFLSRPVAEREAFAREAREQSTRATAGKSMDIMDVSPGAVLDLIQSSGHTRIIHGHTHRPATHAISLPQAVAGATEAQRIVLGDWGESGWFVEIADSSAQLQQFPIP